jgi:hypothetical protein
MLMKTWESFRQHECKQKPGTGDDAGPIDEVLRMRRILHLLTQVDEAPILAESFEIVPNPITAAGEFGCLLLRVILESVLC